jgi:hypothetical protein
VKFILKHVTDTRYLILRMQHAYSELILNV